MNDVATPAPPKPKTILHVLTSEDLALVERLAHLRNDRKEALRVKSKKFDLSKSEYEAHYEGILGELGAARVLGLPIDTTELLSGDKGVDLTLPCGLSVEIRYRTKRGWDFALNGVDISFMKSDIGILVWPGHQPNSVELMGWTSRVHMIMHARMDNFGKGDRLVLAHDRLVPMHTLMEMCRRG
jgi:hypothetical protein